MPRLPTKTGTDTSNITPVPKQASRDKVKLPPASKGGGEYRARGQKSANAKATTRKTRKWRGK